MGHSVLSLVHPCKLHIDIITSINSFNATREAQRILINIEFGNYSLSIKWMFIKNENYVYGERNLNKLNALISKMNYNYESIHASSFENIPFPLIR